ncbi:GGDEF domain-containing protein [Shewanella sp. NIFS-20-20]|uniref:GGDEF domain-containing protein n=1 Tax=Shewanella sp. NIFS-20-20 TaxID=2853806 RepID=UPI001C43B3D3|nr:GGDEF domain-containing protein [Shewanella sp. NIFS-20-20]MBV7314343.1 GGDEF domain-containing protein [Shewanella sp. NIFS-20-20]
MSDALLQTAANHLRKAVPLMMKHQIPTTPTNYALWYAYVAEQQPELNRELDQVIADYQTCPSVTGELLYRQYVADPVELDVRSMRQNLEAMSIELLASLQDTNKDAVKFQNQIDNQFTKLNMIEQEGMSLEQVLSLVKSLVSESDSIRQNTGYFTKQLTKAQSEISELRAKLAQSEADMLHDALTGCLNRRAFDMDIKGLFEQSPEGLCIIMADIDHFKQFNDTFGHQLGDAVLKSVGKRLQEQCRDGAKVYRFGGEEFIIIVAKSNLALARHQAETMRRSLEKLVIKDRRKGAKVDAITASFGVSQWQTKLKIEAVIEEADRQLYQAKHLGRNRVMPIT